MRSHPAARRRRDNTFVPSLEALESRWCPVVSASALRGTLTVLGDAAANSINLQDNANGTVVLRADGAAPRTFTGISRIVLDGRDGNDTIDYFFVNNPEETPESRVLQLGGGNGDDRLTVTISNPEVRTLLDVTVTGGAGNDTLGVQIGTAGALPSASPEIRLTVSGGIGNDTISAGLNNLDERSTVSATVNGDAGNDAVIFAYIIDTTPAPTLTPAAQSIRVNLGDGDDRANVTVNHPCQRSRFDVTINGNAGNDVLDFAAPVLRLDATGVASSDTFNLTLDGGAGLDRVSATFDRATLVGGARLNVTVLGGSGGDIVNVFVGNPEQVPAPTLGALAAGTAGSTAPPPRGQVNVMADAGSGDDQVTVEISDPEQRTMPRPDLGVTLMGRQGADALNLFLRNAEGADDPAQRTVLLLDGAAGNDALRLDFQGVVEAS